VVEVAAEFRAEAAKFLAFLEIVGIVEKNI
jgi:hypothetical protein